MLGAQKEEPPQGPSNATARLKGGGSPAGGSTADQSHGCGGGQAENQENGRGHDVDRTFKVSDSGEIHGDTHFQEVARIPGPI